MPLYAVEARAGVEGSYGSAATPSRRLYFSPGMALTPGGSTIRNAVVTGGRAQIVSARPGASAPAGPWSLPLASEEILELLRVGFQGTPVITTPGGGTTTRLHTYTGPGTALSSMTLQWHDSERPWQLTGVYADNLRIQGNPGVDGNNVLSGDFFGSAFTQTALSGSVTSRTPTPIAGWETKLYIDSVDGTDNYGTTLIAAGESVMDWDLPVSTNNLDRTYTAANTRDPQAANVGVFEATGSMTFKAAGARALTEYNNFRAGTMVRVRYLFGDNVILEGALTSFVSWDMQLVWTSFDLAGESGNVRTYVAEFGYVTDSTNSLSCRVRAQCARTAAF